MSEAEITCTIRFFHGFRSEVAFATGNWRARRQTPKQMKRDLVLLCVCKIMDKYDITKVSITNVKYSVMEE